MILNKIWERYFIKECLKLFFLVLFGFYGLYVLIDYASRIHGSHHFSTHQFEIIRYYTLVFILRSDILIPFALLVATIRTLVHLNVHHELIALLASGVKLKTLMRPFVCLGLFFMLLIYLNNEFLLPYSIKSIAHMEDTYFDQSSKRDSSPSLYNVILEDGSAILYQKFNSAKQVFENAWWIKSADEIYRMKNLAPYSEVPEGAFVDYLKRNSANQLVVRNSMPVHQFSEMHFNTQALAETLTPPQAQRLSVLWKKLPWNQLELTTKQADISATFFRKIAAPWLCLLAIFAPAPFCLRFTRQLPVFFIFLWGIFGMVMLYLALNAAAILGKNQIIPPFWVICAPFFGLFAFFAWKYAKQVR